MKTVKYRHNRVKDLLKGKAKRLGFFESISLLIRGFIDGKRGIPKEEGEIWCSPFLAREIDAHSEHCTRLWGIAQLCNEQKFNRVNELSERLPQLLAILDKKQQELAKELRTEDFAPKVGEERLTAAQIQRRRTTEMDKRLAPRRTEIACLDQEIRKGTEELTSLLSYLKEDANSTRALCQRSGDHTLRRVDLYWASASVKHPERAKLPTVANIHLVSRGEDAYLARHQHKRCNALPFPSIWYACCWLLTEIFMQK